jgi:hypothetical protein
MRSLVLSLVLGVATLATVATASPAEAHAVRVASNHHRAFRYRHGARHWGGVGPYWRGGRYGYGWTRYRYHR